MMGQNNIGEIAKLNDTVLKYVIEIGTQSGTCQIISESINMMQEIFDDTNKKNVDEFKTKIRDTFSHIFNK